MPQTTSDDTGNIKLLSFDATATGDILYVTEQTTSQSIDPSFVVMRNSVFAGLASDTGNSGLQYIAGGLNTTNDQVQIVVDSEINFGVTPQAYTLTSIRIPGRALPIDGTPFTLSQPNDQSWWNQNLLYFDIAQAGQLVHFDIRSPLTLSILLLRFVPDGIAESIADPEEFITTFQGFVRFGQPGHYYLFLFDLPSITANDTLTSVLTNMAITPVTYGTPMTGQKLTAQGSTFYSFHVDATARWAEFGILGKANWGAGAARVRLYDLAGSGWLSNSYPELQMGKQPVDGSSPLGRLVLGSIPDYLVRVENTVENTTAPTFTLDAKERTYVDLGTLSAGTPINRTGMDDIPPGGAARYLVQSNANDRLQLSVTPDNTSNIALDWLQADETSRATADSGPEGIAETLGTVFTTAPPHWAAFSVRNLSQATSSAAISLSSSASPFVNICDATTVLPAPLDGHADDELSDVQTLPAGFTFYGLPVTSFVISSNGYLTFCDAPRCGLSFGVARIPSSDPPNNLVAAYWDDLDGIRVCRKDDSVRHTVTVQWSGHKLSFNQTTVEFEVVLHQNGSVDFNYGDQLADGGSASIGVENAAGTVGKQLVFGQAGGITPGASFSVITP